MKRFTSVGDVAQCTRRVFLQSRIRLGQQTPNGGQACQAGDVFFGKCFNNLPGKDLRPAYNAIFDS